jgi:hypothetical protein
LSQFLFTSKSPANTSIPHRQVFSGDLSAVNMSSCYKGFRATRNNLRFCVNGSELFTPTFQNLRYRLFRPIQTRLKFLTGLSVSYRKHHTESLCIVSTKSSPIRRSADSVQCFTTYGFRDTEGKWPSIQKFVDMRFLLCSMAHLVLNDRIELFVLIRIMMVIESLIGNFRISTVMQIFHSLLTEMYSIKA